MDPSKHVMWRLYRRGHIWWARRTVAGQKERRSTTHADRRLAEAVVLTWHRGDLDPAARSAATTLKAALAAYIDERRGRGRAAGTLSMHAQKATALLETMGEVTLDRVDASAVDAYIAARLAAGLHRSTVGKELSTLRGALRLARRHGLYHREHGEVMPIGWSNDYEPRTRHLTVIDLAKLLRALRPDRAAHAAFIVATGARWGESLRATRGDIDDRAWTIAVRGTKTKGARATIPIPPGGRVLLAEALRRAPQKTGPLFARWINVRRDLAVACEHAGIPPVTPNDLRRTCASWLVQKGVDLFAVSRVLRHADTRMVDRVYGQLPTASLRTMLETADPPALGTVPLLCLTGETRDGWRDVGDAEAWSKCAFVVPRGGIEPSTRGFSIRMPGAVSCGRMAVKRARRRGDVTGLCLARCEPPSELWTLVRAGVGAAQAGDRAGVMGALVEAMRLEVG